MKRLLACFFCAFAFQATAAAHVLDQYLQVAQIALSPGGVRVELRLIPGVQVADRVFALIDVDGDEKISSAEEQAYARRVLQDVALEVDGRRAPLALTGVEFPSRREMNEGIGVIRLDLAAEAASGAAGEHQLSFRNDHLPELGVYLANALVPTTNEIKILGQERDALQHRLRLNFHATPDAAHGRLRRTGVFIFCLCLALFFRQWEPLRRLCAAWKIGRSMRRKVFVANRHWLIALLLLASGAAPQRAYAHQQPTTLVVLDVAPHQVAMNLHVPLSELELAFGNDVSGDPENSLARWQAPFIAYLISHIRPATDGRPWAVGVREITVHKAEQTQSGPFQEVLVHLSLTPLDGVSARRFLLDYDVILHQVVTHKALVSIRNDWERGRTAEEEVGVIKVNTQ